MTEPTRVAVRVRPLLPGEANEPISVSVSAKPPVVSVQVPGEVQQTFAVDHVFTPPGDVAGATQARVYAEVGANLLSDALLGISTCVLAHGEGGSGKSHSILGYGDQPGLIPHITSELFRRTAQKDPPDLVVRCSYLEIRNECLYDLLQPNIASRTGPEPLRAYEQPSGLVIPRLTECAVETVVDIQRFIEYGMRRRAITAKQLRSARSHTVFNLLLERPFEHPVPVHGMGTATPLPGGAAKLVRARMSFVDTARQKTFGRTEQRAADASIVALSAVITKLSSKQRHSARGDGQVLPQGLLPRLFGDAFGGHSKLLMLATVSPTQASVRETISTLRLAAAARLISSRPRAGVVAPEQEVFALQAEIHRQRGILMTDFPSATADARALSEDEEAVERTLQSLQLPLSEQLRQAEQLRQDCTAALQELGFAPRSGERPPCLMNLSDDTMLTGCLVYFLPTDSRVTIGAAPDCSIVLKGLGMAQQHCTIHSKVALQVTTSPSHRVLVNGVPVVKHALQDGDILVLGRAHAFRVVAGRAEHVDVPLSEVDLVAPSASLSMIRRRLDAKREGMNTETFSRLLELFRSLCLLIDDANDIVDEMRPSERLHFEATACVSRLTPLLDLDIEEIPGVRLLRRSGDKGQLLDFWTMSKFVERLELLRSMYDEPSGSVPARVAALHGAAGSACGDPLLDPLGETSLIEVMSRAQAAKWSETVDETDANDEPFSHSALAQPGKLWSGSRRRSAAPRGSTPTVAPPDPESVRPADRKNRQDHTHSLRRPGARTSARPTGCSLPGVSAGNLPSAPEGRHFSKALSRTNSTPAMSGGHGRGPEMGRAVDTRGRGRGRTVKSPKASTPVSPPRGSPKSPPRKPAHTATSPLRWQPPHTTPSGIRSKSPSRSPSSEPKILTRRGV